MFEPRVPLKRLESRIVEFEQETIHKGKILFYGSSGFTRWKPKYGMRPLEEEILGKDGSLACINHGFGSSTAEELLYYYPRAIKPWEPRALVISIVHNDRGWGYSPNEIMTNLAKLMEMARTDFPGIKLYLCDTRPTYKYNSDSVARFCADFHQLCKEYCDRHEDTTLVRHADCADFWIDPADAGAFDAEKIRRDIYVDDEIHFNQLGYDIYRDFMTKVLDDVL